MGLKREACLLRAFPQDQLGGREAEIQAPEGASAPALPSRVGYVVAVACAPTWGVCLQAHLLNVLLFVPEMRLVVGGSLGGPREVTSSTVGTLRGGWRCRVRGFWPRETAAEPVSDRPGAHSRGRDLRHWSQCRSPRVGLCRQCGVLRGGSRRGVTAEALSVARCTCHGALGRDEGTGYRGGKAVAEGCP